LIRQPLLRLLLASAAIAAAVAVAGCDMDRILSINGRHMQPLSERMLADLESRNMAKESPILVRIFKEESELEAWKVDKTGRFALLRTYPICRWSGDLGPKIQQGDRQAPEGFYTVTPNMMNPKSHYHLAINTGFPNAYDRANERSGASLMIHGDCASVGCYAMTDEQITEIYSLARESFFGGQRSFQIQAYPFRMTPLNMAKHRNSPHIDFWKMLKQGYDHFEVTRIEPKIDVCDKHYVFNAESSGKFSPADRCPAFKVPQEIASAVRNKERRDDMQTAQLISRGVAAVVATTGGDGGMNPTFLSALRSQGGPGTTIRTASGTVPAHVHPPAASSPEGTTASVFSIASAEPRPAPVQVASAAPSSGSIGVFFGNLFGSKRENQSAETRGTSAAQSPQAKSQPAPTATPAPTAATGSTHSKPETQRADSQKLATAKPQLSPPHRTTSAEPEATPASTTNLLNGAALTVPAGRFENRFGAWH
jgi:murein L,D-transpeptidase YafK